jgi:hypothetical protein
MTPAFSSIPPLAPKGRLLTFHFILYNSNIATQSPH